jgi:GNAT superfamily N-acetyltransferase
LRADRVEAAFWAGYARNLATSPATRFTGAIPVAGGFAICIQDTYVTYAVGVGSTRSLRADDLRIIAEFYTERSLPVRLELAAAIYARDKELLDAAGFAVERTLQVYERDLTGDLPQPKLSAEAGMRRRIWIELILAALALQPDEQAIARNATRVNAEAATTLVGVRIDGTLAGGGALAVSGDAALLYSGATLTAHRGHGVQTAAILARLATAKARGATWASIKAEPDSPAAHAAQRAGFVATTTRLRVCKAP